MCGALNLLYRNRFPAPTPENETCNHLRSMPGSVKITCDVISSFYQS
uniref:Uncharacterized protein n=1 Tax=Anguilla anguilla TaxID=7936 RepID=A0A0E9W555_ANGAN